MLHVNGREQVQMKHLVMMDAGLDSTPSCVGAMTNS